MPPIPSVVVATSASRTAATRLQSIQRQLASQSGSIAASRGLNTVATTTGNNRRRMVAQKKHKVAIVGSGNW